MWLIGMANRNTQFIVPVSLALRFEANIFKFFAVFDCLVVDTDCSDAKMSRSGNFCADR